MVKKLFVGGLPYSVTNDDLKAHFEQAGEVVSAIHITDKMKHNRPAGYGFVEMADEAGAAKAISMFHDADMGGRKLIVNEAKPREERPRRDFGAPRERRSF